MLLPGFLFQADKTQIQNKQKTNTQIIQNSAHFKNRRLKKNNKHTLIIHYIHTYKVTQFCYYITTLQISLPSSPTTNETTAEVQIRYLQFTSPPNMKLVDLMTQLPPLSSALSGTHLKSCIILQIHKTQLMNLRWGGLHHRAAFK